MKCACFCLFLSMKRNYNANNNNKHPAKHETSTYNTHLTVLFNERVSSMPKNHNLGSQNCSKPESQNWSSTTRWTLPLVWSSIAASASLS
jgi:hypothetical protein